MNIHDFSDESNKNELHPDLIAEIEELGIDRERIKYSTNSKNFVDIEIKPTGISIINYENSIMQGTKHMSCD